MALIDRAQAGDGAGVAAAAGAGWPELEPPDEALARRVAERDAAALAALYDRYAPGIYALAAHMLGRAQAEEVVQEVFLRLWHKAGQFDAGRSSFGAWFMAVARHHVLDELRRHGHQQRLQGVAAVERALAEAADPAVDVEEAAFLREQGSALLRALNDLPAEQRRVLVLAYFGGLSQSAMAEQLGWPLGTVKKRVRLGLQKLRAALAPLAATGDGAPAAPRTPVSGGPGPARTMPAGAARAAGAAGAAAAPGRRGPR